MCDKQRVYVPIKRGPLHVPVGLFLQIKGQHWKVTGAEWAPLRGEWAEWNGSQVVLLERYVFL